MFPLLLGMVLSSAPPAQDTPRAAISFKLRDLVPPALVEEAKTQPSTEGRMTFTAAPQVQLSTWFPTRVALRLAPCAQWGREVFEHSEVVAAGVDIPLHQKVNLMLETTRGIRHLTYWDARAVLRLAFPDVL